MGDQSTDQLETQTDSADFKRSSLAGWLLWFFMFLLLYVLSTGPVVRLAHARIIPVHLIQTIYAPLISLSVAWPPAGAFFDWYLVVVWRC